MTEISESVEPSEVNPPSTALDRVSDNDETDSALDALTNSLMGNEPAEEPATRPARAPPSMAMLQTVMRPSMLSERMAEPPNSMV